MDVPTYPHPHDHVTYPHDAFGFTSSPPPNVRMTDACENITFTRCATRAVIVKDLQWWIHDFSERGANLLFGIICARKCKKDLGGARPSRLPGSATDLSSAVELN